MKKTFQKRYTIFMGTVFLMIVALIIPVHNSIKSRDSNSKGIIIAEKQLDFFQSIHQILFELSLNSSNENKSLKIKKLQDLTEKWTSNHHNLYLIQNSNNDALDSLFQTKDQSYKNILFHIREITRNPNTIDKPLEIIAKNESNYYICLNLIIDKYHSLVEKNNTQIELYIYLLASISLIILFLELIFVLLPVYKKGKAKTDELSRSKEEIGAKLSEINQLKSNLEIQLLQNKIIIDQAPAAITMLDKNMCYLAVSERWIKDFKMEGVKIIGNSIYDIFPEITDDSKAIHQKCLNGASERCEEYPFLRANGELQWLSWDIKPWYDTKAEIGGLLMYSIDITYTKRIELEKIRTETILEKTNKIARIGTWELDIDTDIYCLNDIAREILNISIDFEIDSKKYNNFYNDRGSKALLAKSLCDCIEIGKPYDIELALNTNDGKTSWVREIAQCEFKEGKIKKVAGIIQDITPMKISEEELSDINNQLSKINTELNCILNSTLVSVMLLDNNGIIKHFNKGSEQLLGYFSEEMIGIATADVFVDAVEAENFKIELSKKYGKSIFEIDITSDLTDNNDSDSREWTYIRKDGSRVSVYATLTGIKNEQNEKLGFLALSIDISDRKKIENELILQNQRLVHAEKINKMGHWQFDIINNKSTWSDNLYTILNFDKRIINFSKESYFDLIHPEDKERAVKLHELAIENKIFSPENYRVLLNDGTIKTVQLLGEFVFNDIGEPIEITGTLQDITEQKIAENKFRGLLESAPDAMVIINKDKKIQLINKQAVLLFGYTFEELFDKPVKKLIPKIITDDCKAYFAEDFFLNKQAPEVSKIRELYTISKTGNRIPVQISFNPLQTEEGLLVSLAIRDITIQNEARDKIITTNNELEVLAKRLKHQNIQLADFAQITSHNLRAPVSNLNSLMEIYKLSETDDEKFELFEKFKYVIQHLTSTLNILVDAIKIKNDPQTEKEKLSFTAVLEKTKNIVSGQISESKAIIESDFEGSPIIEYNQSYLESIFLNLIDNAIKYKHPDRPAKIYIKSELTHVGKIKLTFTDNGLGIDMERYAGKIFGLNKTFHRHPKARGVGLFMTKTQIEASGGMIFVSSEVNKGTTFTIII